MLQCIRHHRGIPSGERWRRERFSISILHIPKNFVPSSVFASRCARVFVFVLTLSPFRKIVDTQRQKKIDAHSLGENA